MTKTCKLVKALLKGEVVSILTGFKRFLISNTPREIGRSIDRKFGVKCDKKQINFKSECGEAGYYFEYRLLATPENAEGRALMEAYVREIEQSDFQSIVRKGAKTKHVKEYNKKADQPAQRQKSLFESDQFIVPPVENISWDSPIH